MLSEFTDPGVSSHQSSNSEMQSVFTTAFLVAFIEATCIELISMHLDEDELSVSTLVDLCHIRPIVVGEIVKVSVNLVKIEKPKLRFSVAVWGSTGVIGYGRHECAIEDRPRFIEKVAEKSKQAARLTIS